ncbi:hypothetical protein G5714_021838 [Onychostoma macrolepis]|uniref:Uncharacterized protein n=1 Tax=Onychostoma macrolepis TaxID=369639 RepID=A0A7J6BS71_9TELE|nr:hypothetical protein G5714_021838 [Onychostoma macrolepis]
MLSMRCVFDWTALKNPLGQSEPARLFLLAGLLTVWEVTREHNVGSGGEFIHSLSQRRSPMTVNGSSAQTPSTIQTKTSNSSLFYRSWMGEPDSPHKHPSRDVPVFH